VVELLKFVATMHCVPVEARGKFKSKNTVQLDKHMSL